MYKYIAYDAKTYLWFLGMLNENIFSWKLGC